MTDTAQFSKLRSRPEPGQRVRFEKVDATAKTPRAPSPRQNGISLFWKIQKIAWRSWRLGGSANVTRPVAVKSRVRDERLFE
jgi:hypothetical protein